MVNLGGFRNTRALQYYYSGAAEDVQDVITTSVLGQRKHRVKDMQFAVWVCVRAIYEMVPAGNVAGKPEYGIVMWHPGSAHAWGR